MSGFRTETNWVRGSDWPAVEVWRVKRLYFGFTKAHPVCDSVGNFYEIFASRDFLTNLKDLIEDVTLMNNAPEKPPC